MEDIVLKGVHGYSLIGDANSIGRSTGPTDPNFMQFQ